MEPTKTIPRVIVVSILLVALLYLLMNVSVLSVLPAKEAMASKSTVSDFVAAVAGRPLAQVVTVLILWTAFASVFSLTLGYSRILWAAARDGNFFRVFARLHPTGGYPAIALFALGGAAALFSFVDLRTVVMSILSIRAIIPFIAQIGGALILRRRLPDSARPVPDVALPAPGARGSRPLGLRPLLSGEGPEGSRARRHGSRHDRIPRPRPGRPRMAVPASRRVSPGPKRDAKIPRPRGATYPSG